MREKRRSFVKSLQVFMENEVMRNERCLIDGLISPPDNPDSVIQKNHHVWVCCFVFHPLCACVYAHLQEGRCYFHMLMHACISTIH